MFHRSITHYSKVGNNRICTCYLSQNGSFCKISLPMLILELIKIPTDVITKMLGYPRFILVNVINACMGMASIPIKKLNFTTVITFGS